MTTPSSQPAGSALDTEAAPPPAEIPKRRRGPLLGVFAVTIFIGSALLFLVQPLFAKMVLPLLGGTPSVWATSMVFYQATLLAGYAYAHWSVARLGTRRQARLQMLLVLLPLPLLPIAVPEGWVPPATGQPIVWLLGMLTLSLGLPFFVLSSSAPLLQRWFASTEHEAGRDPYFLYAASNLGSMLALLAYPFVLEPAMPLASQSRLWAVGYGLLAAGTIVCALTLLRTRRDEAAIGQAQTNEQGAPEGKPVTATRRLRWVALAFVPSAFMLAVTTHISTDIAAIPLLWVVPLALYLLTFILAFAPKPVSSVWPARLMPAVIIPLVLVLLVGNATLPRVVLIGLPLAALFVAALVCHTQLAEDRPPPRHLTEFYLWVAVGGVLGGIFTALLAPAIFDTVLEYPLVIIMACLLAPTLIRRPINVRREQIVLMVLPAGVLLATVLLIAGAVRWLPTIGRMVALATALCLCSLLITRPLRFGLSLGAVMVAASMTATDPGTVLYSGRTFFGVQRVLEDNLGFHRLLHGTTLHGIQSTRPHLRREPLSYYHREGPVGQVMTEHSAANAPRIGVVGLGTGSLACYARPGQEWVFYEIDPVMERIARTPRLFTYLSDCPGDHEVVLGDARISLDRAGDGRFGVLVVDAFNSDAIPVHLLTREAIELYMQKLAPGGVVAIHISNRYLDLEPVLANVARDLDLAGLHRSDGASLPQARVGKTASQWVVLARSAADLERLSGDRRWRQLAAKPGSRTWTDDFSDVFSVFRWQYR